LKDDVRGGRDKLKLGRKYPHLMVIWDEKEQASQYLAFEG